MGGSDQSSHRLGHVGKEVIAAEATKRREPRDDGKSLGRLEDYRIKPKCRCNLRA